MSAGELSRPGDPLSDFFLESPAKLDDPFADLAWLREHRPVHWHESIKQWFVFRYDDVRALFADRRLSANRMSGFVDAAPVTVRDELRTLVPYLEKWLLMTDGAAHARLRKVLHRGFNATAIEALREPIERAANALLDRAVHDRTLDVASDFAFLLPAYVLSDFMGVRTEDRDRVVQWSVDFVDFFNLIPITEDTTRRMVRSAREMTAYTRELLEHRHAVAQADFLGLMAGAARAGEITEEEILGNTLLVLIAGHVAVRNLIGNVIWLLIQHPAELQRLREDPDLLGSVVEESLRVEPPITLIPRVASEAIQLRGETISAGDIVQLSIAAANRDPARFPDPDRFDAGRNPRGVLSFGHGPHGCLGARLAIEQSLIALQVLFERLGTRFGLSDEADVRWYRNAGNRGPERLPIRF
jgi:cytochrome P450